MSYAVGAVWYDVQVETRDAITGLRKVEREADRTGAGFDKLQAKVTAVAAAVTAAISAIAIEGLVSKLVAAQRQFDVMFASLKTMTGGAQQAGQAWERLQKFAATTPYSLQQSVDGFVKLKALGLDPSERAMTSFGNTAAAMGKSLTQMIEAVADASTGEFERLKQFGIKAKVEGDKVALTFRGTTTTVRNSADEITEYLIKIGEVEFAGAMSERMKTLDGDISNLEDSLAALYLTISQSGFGDAIASGVRAATEAIQEATTSIKEGGLTEYFDALRPYITAAEVAVVSLAGAVAGRLVASFLAMAAQAYSTAAGLGAATVAARGFTAIVAALGGPIGIAVTALTLLALNWDKVGTSARDAATVTEDAAARIAEALKKAPHRAAKDLEDQVAGLKKELGTAKSAVVNLKVGTYGKGTPEQIQAAQDRVTALEGAIERAQRAMHSLVDVSPPVMEPDKSKGPPKPTGKPSKFDSAGYLSGLYVQTLEGLDRIDALEQEHLRRNDERLKAKEITAAVHARAATLIETNAARERHEIQMAWGEERRAQIERDAEAELAAGKRLTEQLAKSRAAAMDAIVGGDPVAQLRLELERRTAEMDAAAARDLERSALYAEAKVALERNTSARIAQVLRDQETARINAQRAQLDGMSTVFGALADLTKGYAGEQSDSYKALFALQKGFAISSAILSMYQGAATAMQKGWPDGLVEMGAVLAQGAGLLATIRGTNYGGGRQYGGPTSAGSLYRINETGRPEMFTGNNGAQYMLPTQSGNVTPANQVGGAATHITQEFHIYVQGDASENTVQLIRSAQAQFAAQLLQQEDA